MLQKEPRKYLHGGCGAVIDLPLNPKRLIPARTECGLEIDFLPLYCDKCQKEREEIDFYARGC
jgi:hypothetical protein